MSVAWVGVGVSALGAISQASAAGDAADAQSESSQAASMQQAMAAAQLRQDLSPWTNTGAAANNKLSQYLGLGMAPGSTISNGMTAGLTRDQLRQQLLSQYTKQSTSTTQPTGSYNGYNDAGLPGLFEPLYENGKQSGVSFNGNNQYDNSGNDWLSKQASITGSASTSTVDEAGLNAAIDKYYADQAAEQEKFASDPNYGSLLTPYRNGAEFDSGPAYDSGAAFSFTGEDLKNDPGYKFGLDQGTQGIERAQASRGNFLSGAAMKEATRFNEDYAGTKFNEGFNRASSIYGTNQAKNLNEYNTNLTRRQNEWNTNLGAYNQNRNTIYNFLTGQSTIGQNSAATVGANNQQTANAIGNNTMAAGNAQAAGAVSSSNALVNGMNQGVNALSSGNPNSAAGWNSLLTRNGGGYSGYTGYVGGSDPIANLNTTNGWTQ